MIESQILTLACSAPWRATDKATMRFCWHGHLVWGHLLVAVSAAAADVPSAIEASDATDSHLPQPALKLSPGLTPQAEGEAGRATFITADHISGREDVETVAEGHVEMRRAANTLSADRLTYWPVEDEMEAVGNVRLTKNADIMTGPHLRLQMTDSLGFFDQPHYAIKRMAKNKSPFALPQEPVTATGDASRLDFEGEGHYRLAAATYSTCAPPGRDWYVQADEIRLDYDREVGDASSVKVVFKNAPIFYSPWLSFSLNGRRKSGFLAPTFGSTSTSGLDFTLPWYWNIAPDMDATISARLMTKRGMQVNGEFRYLEPNGATPFENHARVEFLPNDNITHKNRSAYAIIHNQILAPNITGQINVNGASDDTYFTDLSSRLSVTSQTNLVRQGILSYGGGWYSATMQALRYQTLQDPAAPVTVPYYMMPQIMLTAARPDLPAGMAFNFSGEYVNFGHPTLVQGRRAMVYPQVSLPLQTSAFFLTPKVGVHVTRYSLQDQAAGSPDQVSRQVPIVSVDSGVVMERNVDWQGHSLIQTLEPRFYYVKIPYRDQSQIPVYDSGVATFNFTQMFSENRYVGNDRIGDANQITAAAVSRLIDPATGSELMRGAVGQRYYFNSQQVTLPGEAARTDRKTDLLATFSGRVMPRAFLDAGWQYSPSRHETEVVNLGARYQPEINKVVNAGYRFTRDQIKQIDLSAQWPLWGGWYAVTRYNYSIKDHKLIEALGGLEYDGGCWVARLVVHRLATLTGASTSAIFFQLELNGLAQIGSNPIDMLKRNIPGYGIINQPTADPIFGAY
jgi:LPS-assembly protein